MTNIQDVLRPYPPTGLSTEQWKEIPETEVDIRLLTPTQNHLTFKQFINALLPEGYMDPCPYVVLHQGVRWIEDGHHRSSRLLCAVKGRSCAGS